MHGGHHQGMAQSRIWLVASTLLLVGMSGCTLPEEPTDTTAAPAPPVTLDEASTFRVIYVDVGQGDGTIWLTPDGQAVVYDCGPAASDADDNPMVRALRDLGFSAGDSLHALVASHGHLDHIGGCEEVFSEYQIQHVYETWYEGDDRPKSYQRFQDQILAEVAAGATLHVVDSPHAPTGASMVAAGDVIDFGGVSAEVLWPLDQADDWDNIAEHSFVLRASHGSVDFCFQGDIEDDQEQDLVPRFGDRDCNIYLVGHHGSRHASSTNWLAAMAPELAVASVGKNSYGHPHPDATGRLQVAGVPLLTTQLNGTITVTSTGAGFQVATERTGEAPPASDEQPPAAGDAWILGVNADPPGTDNDNLAEEYVRITNPTDAAVDMSGWSLLDEVDTTYNFPDGFTLAAGAEVLVRTGTGTDSATDLYWGRGSAVWNNSGDVAILYDDHGGIVAQFSY